MSKTKDALTDFLRDIDRRYAEQQAIIANAADPVERARAEGYRAALVTDSIKLRNIIKHGELANNWTTLAA
jgi:hypothetical protein